MSRGIASLAFLLLLAWGTLYLYTERVMQGADIPLSAGLPKGDPAINSSCA